MIEDRISRVRSELENQLPLSPKPHGHETVCEMAQHAQATLFEKGTTGKSGVQ